MSRPDTPTRARRRPTVAAIGALTALALAGTSGAATASTTTSLDAYAPIDAAAFGDTAAWLRPTPATANANDADDVVAGALVARDPGAAVARDVTTALPKGTDALNVGSDANGDAVALLDADRGFYVVPLDGSAAPRRIAGSSRWTTATLFRGHVAYTKPKGERSLVYVASRIGAKGRLAYTMPRRWTPDDLVLGRGDAVFVHAGKPVDVGVGDLVWRVRVGSAPKRVLSQSTGGASDNGMGRPTVNAAGTRVNVSRWNDGGGHANDLSVLSVASGRTLSQRRASTVTGADAVYELGLDSGASIVTSAVGSGCADAGTTPQKGQVPCLGVGLVR